MNTGSFADQLIYKLGLPCLGMLGKTRPRNIFCDDVQERKEVDIEVPLA